ncbi:aminotransferase [Sulfuriferula plumbiphila]|uniref:cysteine-S-conjugate beta-lyase n=1 Tax=Sulfuriferula plumbiphila TaxID=171865 RepID=A0A512L7H2_9PROT|nr:pyridoxal phosphate-dependent aminotransferase [Sulfuriferula plumbiphila]BBP04048.1 aminotransferase [Sulfuriferula plumbiphila]GEP30435.1 aminotransferase [Sulfuriferula plumbiphila]
MSFDFDQTIPREGTASVKHDGRTAYFGTADVTPLWVADMDFAAPPAVTAALVARAAHPIYGYTRYPDSLYDALIAWMQQRHGWSVKREWIIMCPGVVPSLHAAVMAFARAGEGVIVQPPVYFPFFSAVTSSARRLIENPLRLTDGRYQIDFGHLEHCAASGAKLLLLCSPHNPVGRVWQHDELVEILRIARRHKLVVLSDEIHADLVYPGQHHTVLATLADEADSLITAVAPSKSFNIPGLGLSCLIIPDPELRAATGEVFASQHVSASNPFSIVAFEAAYRDGGAWLDALMAYLQGTRDFVLYYARQHLPGIRPIAPEGTYLVWLDCRDMQLSDPALRDFFIHQAGLGMNPGTVFGTGGSGFMRLNLASPRHIIAAALARVSQACGFSG